MSFSLPMNHSFKSGGSGCFSTSSSYGFSVLPVFSVSCRLLPLDASWWAFQHFLNASIYEGVRQNANDECPLRQRHTSSLHCLQSLVLCQQSPIFVFSSAKDCIGVIERTLGETVAACLTCTSTVDYTLVPASLDVSNIEWLPLL